MGTNATPKRKKGPGKPKTPRHRAPIWKKAFLASLAETCNVRAACETAKIDRKTAYRNRHSDAEFAEAWDDALDSAIDALETEAQRRAFKGVEEPVFYLGKEVAKIRKYSDNLLMFFLKAYRPERFRDLNLDQLADAILRRSSSPQLHAVSPPIKKKSGS